MATGISARGAQVIAWAYVTVSIAALFVLLRLYVRWKVVNAIGKEDGLVTAALVFALLTCICMNLEVSQGGLGQHWVDLTEAQEEAFLRASYLSIIFYNISLSLTKFSILCLCLRVFGPSKWRTACYTVFVGICIYSVWSIFSSIAPCFPVQKYWLLDKVDGWCFPRAVLWFLNASLNIFTDFIIVLLPIPGILALQLPKKQKIGVSLVFLLGFFVCIISVVRLKALYTGALAQDSTYDNFGIAIWSVIEVNGAIVGACLPTLKPLITKLFPRLLSSGRSNGQTYNTHSYYRHGTGADGTRTTTNRRTGTGLEDFSSERGIFPGDTDLVLSDLDTKGGTVRTNKMSDEDLSGTEDVENRSDGHPDERAEQP
ncbi:hypothetical protein K491DRAFT_719793, partial [Lophiostoma macrostomum CBS 122681]